jgi:hypothetical protein
LDGLVHDEAVLGNMQKNFEPKMVTALLQFRTKEKLAPAHIDLCHKALSIYKDSEDCIEKASNWIDKFQEVLPQNFSVVLSEHEQHSELGSNIKDDDLHSYILGDLISEEDKVSGKRVFELKKSEFGIDFFQESGDMDMMNEIKPLDKKQLECEGNFDIVDDRYSRSALNSMSCFPKYFPKNKAKAKNFSDNLIPLQASYIKKGQLLRISHSWTNRQRSNCFYC